MYLLLVMFELTSKLGPKKWSTRHCKWSLNLTLEANVFVLLTVLRFQLFVHKVKETAHSSCRNQ